MPRTESFLAVGVALKQYRKEQQITQAELADQLGLSQPYLSRIESGKRDGLSPLVWEAISSVVDIDFLDLVNPKLDELSDRLERGLLALGGGHLEESEALFLGVMNSVAAVRRPTAALIDLNARATSRVAGIRRDRYEISGEGNALTLYSKVQAAYASLGNAGRIREIKLMTGACNEMLKKHPLALGVYKELLTEPKSLDPLDDRMKTRLNTRIAALLTKMNKLDDARKHLAISISLAPRLEGSGPYSLTHEKAAILEIRSGHLLEANHHLDQATSEIGSADHLRLIQNQCVRADLYIASGEPSLAIRELREALETATEQQYLHQVAYIQQRYREALDADL